MPLILREQKGAALTFEELDGNFTFLNSGSVNGSLVNYSSSLSGSITANGQGFGNVLVGKVHSGLTTGITASDIITIHSSSVSTLNFVTASLSNTQNFLGIALETKNSNEDIRILTQGYVTTYSNTYINQGAIKESTVTANSAIFFSGSLLTTVKPASNVRAVGFVLNTTAFNTEPIYIYFNPSTYTVD
jgi:hypothetical protein